MARNRKQNPENPEQIDTPAQQTPQNNNASGDLVRLPTPEFIRKRRRRRAVLIGMGLALTGIVTLGIIAFLGQRSGSFTVQLVGDARAQLSLGTTLNSDDPGMATDLTDNTAYLNAAGFQATSTINADLLYSQYGGDEVLDADLTTANAAERKNSLIGNGEQFWAYTFYLKNQEASSLAYFSYNMVTVVNSEPTNLEHSVSLKKILRIRLYENRYQTDGSIVHNMTTYAWRRDEVNDEGNNREYIQDPYMTGVPATYEQNRGTCDYFAQMPEAGNFTVFEKEDYLHIGEIRRFTIVMWLAGDDEDTVKAEELPKDGSITFSMTFTGHHKTDQSEE